jgi:hypothetical protein
MSQSYSVFFKVEGYRYLVIIGLNIQAGQKATCGKCNFPNRGLFPNFFSQSNPIFSSESAF